MKNSITYKDVELDIEYDLLNDSFSHEFGIEKKDNHIEITDIFINNISIILLLNDECLDSLASIILKGLE